MTSYLKITIYLAIQITNMKNRKKTLGIKQYLILLIISKIMILITTTMKIIIIKITMTQVMTAIQK